MRRPYNILANTDWISVGLYLGLVLLGWLNIYAAVYSEEHHSIVDLSQRYGKQLVWILAAVVLAITVFLIDTKFYSFFAYILYGISIFMLVAVMFLGKEIHGARSWFQFGSFNLQPSEFAKITTCLALARYLSSYNLKIKSIRTSLIILCIIFLPSLLIAIQPDMGSAMVFIALILVGYREGFSELILVVGIILGVLFFLSLLLSQFIILAILACMGLLAFWILSRSFTKTLAGSLFVALPFALLFVLDRQEIVHLNRYFILLLSLIIPLPFYLVYAYRKRLRYLYLLLLFLAGSAAFTFSVDYVFHNVLKEHQQHRVGEVVLLGKQWIEHGIREYQHQVRTEPR